MSRKDEFGFNLPNKKDKKERPQREKKEGKNLFGEGSFLGGLSFKKSSFFGDESFFGKEKNNEKSPIRLKWWHILLIVLGAIIIVVGIIAGILIGQVNNMIPGGIGSIIEGGDGGEGGGLGEEIPENESVVSSVGLFLPNDTQEYILCEYTEYFSGETMVVLQKPDEVRYDYKPYWVFITEDGQPYYHFSDEFPENDTPEQVKKDLFSLLPAFGYTEEKLALCDMHVYEPVSFTRVKISEVTLTDTEVTVKYSAGAVDGEMSEEYTLTGTYTKEDNDFIFTYTTLPEDENLLRVAENLLGAAKYEYYAQYGSWVNELTFGDDYKLPLVSPAEEE